MKLHETPFGRLLAQVLVYALVQASIPPAWAVSLEAPRSLPESPRQQTKPTAFESYAAELSSVNPDWDKLQRLAQSFPVVEKPAASRVLGASEMESRKGLLAVNPYVAGSQKWNVNYAGIDLLTGNFSTSATDLSFEGGYGIPINVTRTYSSNNPDDGPLGRGWTLSVDIRTTAGGILKGKGSPDRSVPVQIFDRPQNEPARGTEEVSFPNTILTEGVIARDAGGFEEDIMRDVDGILTTPPWDSNVYGGALEKVDGEEYWLNTSLAMTTPEGTVYEYSKHGYYTGGGAKSAFDETSTPTRTPSNILKIDRITDRHGNETTFDYEGGSVNYYRPTGTVNETLLSEITMPGGRSLHLTYQYSGSVNTGHLARIADGTTSDARCVDYTYSDNMLTQVETGITVGSQANPLVTSYDYGSAGPSTWEGGPAGDLLTSIIDPRGLETEIYYWMGVTRMLPYRSWGIPAPHCFAVKSPSGVYSIAQPYEANDALLLGGSLPTSHGTGHDDIVIGQYLRTGSTWTELSKGQLFISGPGTDINGDFIVRMTDMRAATPLSGTVNPTTWERIYNINLGHLEKETTFIHPWPDEQNSLRMPRGLGADSFKEQKAYSEMKYNFLGAPLEKETVFSTVNSGSSTYTAVSSSKVQYAYYGPEKYFQQKAMRAKVDEEEWRYSYTDYYENTQYTGGAARGLTYRVYDPKYGGITCTDESDGQWRTHISPTANHHSAQFKYDSEGRVTEVEKLHNTSGTWTYVKTTTSYLGSGSGAWGLPGSVVEDAGTGTGYARRTTTTDEYDRAGRATVVTDGADRTFETTYNARGQVVSVYRTDPTTPVFISGTTYGDQDGDVTNGMATVVEDGISGCMTTIDYFDPTELESNLGRLGQVQSVLNEDDLLWGSYTAVYDYDLAGRRMTTDYLFEWNVNGDTHYAYDDYLCVGSPESPSYVFQTMTLLDDEGDYTAEAHHYRFDTAGRMLEAAFAQTPTATSAPWYTPSYPADQRAHAIYTYRPAGQLAELKYIWDSWDPEETIYTSVNIGKVAYAYDAYKGLRESATFTPGSGSGWGTSRTEAYGYDDDLDYLTSVDYDTSTSTPAPDTWSYDAAGNRSNSGYTYDKLNMMTASPGATYEHDDLGNRTWKNKNASGAWRYYWDDAGRMIKAAGPGDGATYQYRADGMRIRKISGLSLQWIENPQTSSGFYDEIQNVNNDTTRYRYDGQMCFEDDFARITGYPHNPTTTITGNSYALGARGIDMIRPYTLSISTNTRTYGAAQFPIYDGHGNMIATLVRDGDSFDLTNQRAYDVWGDVRTTNGTGDPNNRYCANLGHKQDDESDLIYMRARYYEPGTGRFVSEDPAMDGGNWYIYCDNDPTNKVDTTGRNPIVLQAALFATGFALGAWFGNYAGTLIFQNLVQAGGLWGTWNGNQSVVDASDRTLNIYNHIVSQGMRAVGDALVGVGLEALGVTAGAQWVAGLSAGGAAGIGLLCGLLVGFFMAMLQGYISYEFQGYTP